MEITPKFVPNKFVPMEIITPKPKPRPRSERSTPVRNPAFRENEALRALQKQLNSRR
jgi:hypothetical protein